MDIRAIRAELGLSQSELAALAGVSKRAVQSYEQGWRRPSETVERVMLLLLLAHRNGGNLGDDRCWEVKQCPPNLRDNCIAYITRQGHLCWFFTGTMCAGTRMGRWADKLRTCLECRFMQRLLNGVHEKVAPNASI